MTITVKFTKNSKGLLSQVDVNNTVFFYVQTGDRKSPIYDEKDLPKNQQKNFEQSIQFLVNEDIADQLSEVFPKMSIKKYLSKEKLLDKIKVDDPARLPDMKKYFVVKVTQKLQDRDGKAKDPRLLARAFKVDDGKAVEITHTEAIGNASYGNVRLSVSNTKNYGCIAYPKMLLITDLVEYAAGEDLSDFLGDLVVEAEEPPVKTESDMMDELDDAPFETENEVEYSLFDEDEDLY